MRHLGRYLYLLFRKKEKHPYNIQDWIIHISVCEITALCTFYIHSYFQLNVVLVASFIGIILGLISKKERFKNIQFVGYCGVFVGMSSTLILPSILFISLAGIIAGILYNVSSSILFGYGGRIGTIAFISVIGVYILHVMFK